MQEKKMTGYPSIDMPHCKESKFSEKHPFIPSVDIITVLRSLSKKHRNQNAIDCNELQVTYQQLLDDSHIMYLAFKRLGIQKGDIVTISLPSNYHALISFFGLNELGAITTFIDTYSSEDDILSYLNKYQSPVFINYEKSPYDIKDKLNKSKLKYIITLNESLVNSRDFLMKDRLDYNSQLVDFHSLGFYAKQQKKYFPLYRGKCVICPAAIRWH